MHVFLAVFATLIASVVAYSPAALGNPGQAAYDLGVHHYQQGEFAKAAGLFKDAYKLDPKPVYLFNAARSTHKLGDLSGAKQAYVQLLAIKPLEPAIELRARRFLDEVRSLLARKEAEKEAQERANARAAEEQRERERQRLHAASAARTRKMFGYGGIGAGAALLAAGGWLLSSWFSHQATLDGKLRDKDESGNVVGISHEAYGTEQDRIDRLGIGGAAVVGVGAVAAGLGAWWLLSARQPNKSSVGFQLRPGWTGSQVIFSASF